jgi:hypothetical protein
MVIFGKIKKNMLIHSWFENKATRHKSDLQNSQQRA